MPHLIVSCRFGSPYKADSLSRLQDHGLRPLQHALKCHEAFVVGCHDRLLGFGQRKSCGYPCVARFVLEIGASRTTSNSSQLVV